MRLLDNTHRTRTEKLDSIIGNLETYHVETKYGLCRTNPSSPFVCLRTIARKNIIAQAILEKNSTDLHQAGNATDTSSGNPNNIRESNVVAAGLRSRWEPGAEKPTIKSTKKSGLAPETLGLAPPVPKSLGEKTVARLDACDKRYASALDKFHTPKEPPRRDPAQLSGGSGGAALVAGIGDPRLAGRPMDYDASRDPRLRR